MFIDFLFEVFRQNAESEAVIWHNQSFAYRKLLDRTNEWRSYLRENRVAAGTVTAIQADFSPNAIALMLVLIETGCIVVPLTSSVAAKKAEFMAIAGVEALLELDGHDEVRLTRLEQPRAHELLQRLRNRGHPGLILFSSGSTGESKAAVHDIVSMLGKFKARRHARRAITFLLYDHIGGFNTMLYQLSNAGMHHHGAGPRPRHCVARSRTAQSGTAAHFTDIHQPCSAERSVSSLRFVFFENCQLRDGANAREHTAPLS